MATWTLHMAEAARIWNGFIKCKPKKGIWRGVKRYFSEGDKKAVKRVENEIKSIENNIKSLRLKKLIFKDIENLNKVAQIYRGRKIQGQIASLKNDITKTTETFKNKAAITENINQFLQ